MAVYLITTIKRFIGESFDVKPTDGVLPGSTFFETDTKNEGIYTGAAWVYTAGNPVFAIRATQGIKITEEEEEWQTAYIVNVLQQMSFAESRDAIVYVAIPAAANSMKFSEATGLRMDGDLRLSDSMNITEAVSLAEE